VMFLRDVALTLRRRWYLTVGGLVATVALCLTTLMIVPPTYSAEASLVLLPPASSVDNGGNPFLQLGGLDTVVSVLVRSLGSQTSSEAVGAAVPGGTFQVTPDYATNGPILVITAANNSPVSTLATLDRVIESAQPALSDLQESAGIQAGSRITIQVLSTDDHAEAVRKSQIRVLIVVAAIGLVCSVLIIALVDSWLYRRRLLRQSSSSSLDGESVILSIGESPAFTGGRSARAGRRRPLDSFGTSEPRKPIEIEGARNDPDARRSSSEDQNGSPGDRKDTANGSGIGRHSASGTRSYPSPAKRRLGLNSPTIRDDDSDRRSGGSPDSGGSD
jgi:hypothetical protein